MSTTSGPTSCSPTRSASGRSRRSASRTSTSRRATCAKRTPRPSRRRRRAESARDGADAGTRGPAAGASHRRGTLADLAVVAVAAGEGLAAIFRDFGVSRVVLGGQTANPSTGELLEAVKSVHAREVLRPAEQPERRPRRAPGRGAGRPARRRSSPTRNAAEGFAALLALDPTQSAADNATEMTAAGRAIQSLSVTEAVRDATIGGRKVKKGQTIALDPDDGLVAVRRRRDDGGPGGDPSPGPGFELITLYYGDGGDLAGTEASRPQDPRARRRAPRSRSSTAASRTTAT